MEAFMFVEISNNNNTKYIRLVESVRVTLADGTRATRKKTILNVGPLVKFDDGKPEYERRLKESFKNGSPIIPLLEPYSKKQSPREKFNFSIESGSMDCIGHPKLYAQCLIERILEELGLIQVLSSYKGFSKIEFDIVGFFRLLLYGRILNPVSKIATIQQNDSYYDAVVKDPYAYNIYDALDFLYENQKQILRRMNTMLIEKFHRTTDFIYYDVTNFFFEIDEPDENTEENGIVVKGYRQCGVSKEERPLPIIQMGLFMDEQGIPISVEMFPGNTLDHQTVKPALSKSVDNLDFGRFIFVGDRGMCNYKNLAHILEHGNGYVVR
jgi:hypothetical protein